jgi:zinc protease
MFLAGMTIKIRDDDPDYPALLFANYLMGQGINSRLFARIRGKEGLSYGIGSSLIVTPDQDNARFVVNAISAPENAWKVEASFLDELSLVLKGGFTEAEIDAGKKSWLQAQQLNRDQDPTLAGSLISQTHYGRTMAWDVELQNRVQALSSQDILAALRKHIDLNALTIMKGGDFKKAAPQ